MSNHRWLYLPVEVKVRELDAKLLLSYYAIKEGYQVLLGDHPTMEGIAGYYPSGIYFTKGGPKGFRKRTITKAMENEQTIVELDEEGLLINKETYILDRMRRDMLQHVEQEYCWGNLQKEIISNSYPDLKHKCHVVGNPRFDLLQKKYREIYRNDVEALHEKYQDFILINTRFSLYNSVKGKKETVYLKPMKKLYHAFLEMITCLAKKFPHLNIVIRPHPGENSKSYLRAFKQFRNIHVVHEGSIIKWLQAAKVIIHNGCTSGIEAFLLGRPVISYVPFKTNDITLPNQLGIQATTIASLHQAIENLSDYEQVKQTPTDLYDYYHWEQDEFSFDKILDLCNKIPLPPPPDKISLPRQLKLKKLKRNFSLSKEEIVLFYKKLDQIEQKPFDRTIEYVAPNVYCIYANHI